MKVALVHDYLKEYGGAERVLEALHEVWPEAPVFTAFVDWEGLGIHAKRFKDWEIHESWVGKLPFLKKLHSPLRFLAPLIWRSFDFNPPAGGFDIVISSSSVYFGKGINKNGALHISYCHTPPRFLYGYPTAIEWRKNGAIRVMGEIINHFLRLYDWQIAQRVDYFLANSQETASRIKKFYRRASTVIYPPVELAVGALRSGVGSDKFPNASVLRPADWRASDTPRKAGSRENLLRDTPPRALTKFSKPYFLCVSRLARAKRIDLAIEACNRLKLPLKVVGTGREEKKLEAMGGETVEFLGEVSDEELARLYADCRAVIFPAVEEDFGIVPVEAMSFGKPVIALRSGGVVESVIDGKTGIFFKEPTVESLIEAIQQFSNLTIKPENCQKQAQKFSKERFKKEMKEFVDSHRFTTDSHR